MPSVVGEMTKGAVFDVLVDGEACGGGTNDQALLSNGTVGQWTTLLESHINDLQSYALQATTITVAGTTDEVTSSAGAQDLSANRAWTLGLADNAVMPGNNDLTLPIGTTEQEIGTTNGMVRYNSTTNKFRAYENGAWADMIGGGGSSLPVVDATSIAEGSADATKEVRFEVDGNTTGIVGVLATVFTTAKTVTFPDATDTLVGKATTDTLTNKSIALGANPLTGTMSEFDTAVTDGNFAYSGGAFHDGFSDFVANEHLDWTASVGTIHTDNYIEGGAGTDTTALHDNVANEITAITAKTSAVAADEFVMEDSAAAFVKKAITFANLEGALSLANLGGTLPIASGGTNVTSFATDGALVRYESTGTKLETGTVTHPSANLLGELRVIKSSTTNIELQDSSSGIMFVCNAGGLPLVNYFQATANVSGGGLTLKAQSTVDANVTLTINARGANNLVLGGDTGNVEIATGIDLIITSGYLDFTAVGSTIKANAVTKLTLNTSDVTVTPKLIATSDIQFAADNAILDSNANELIAFVATASAVNYLEIVNAATGISGPIIRAAGEANLSIRLTPAGTGSVVVTPGDLVVNSGGVLINSQGNRLQFGSGSGDAWFRHPTVGGFQFETDGETDFHFQGSLDTITFNGARLYGSTASAGSLEFQATTGASSGSIRFMDGGVSQWQIKANTGDLASIAGSKLGIGIGANTVPDEIVHAYHATLGAFKMQTEAGSSRVELQSFAGTSPGKPSQIQLKRARGTLTTPLINVTNDQVGDFRAWPWFGGTFKARAGIVMRTDGLQTGTSNLPTRVTFTAGASASTERGRFNSDGTFEADSWVGFNGKIAAAPNRGNSGYTTATYTADRTVPNSVGISAQTLGDILSTLIDDLIVTGIIV